MITVWQRASAILSTMRYIVTLALCWQLPKIGNYTSPHQSMACWVTGKVTGAQHVCMTITRDTQFHLGNFQQHTLKCHKLNSYPGKTGKSPSATSSSHLLSHSLIMMKLHQGTRQEVITEIDDAQWCAKTNRLAFEKGICCQPTTIAIPAHISL